MNWEKLKHLILYLLVTVSQLICILKHLFGENFAVFSHQRFHGELDKHFIGVFTRGFFDNLLRLRDIVVLTPHELFQCLGVHTKLLCYAWAHWVKCEAPVVDSWAESHISFFRWVEVFLFGSLKLSICHFFTSTWIVWWETSVAFLALLLLLLQVIALNELWRIAISIFDDLHHPIVAFFCVIPLIDD